MRALAGAILVGCIGASNFNLVPAPLEQLNDSIAMEVPTLIDTHILVRDVATTTTSVEPLIEEVNGWRFGAKALTIECTTVMVGNQAVTSLTIDTFQTVIATSVVRAP